MKAAVISRYGGPEAIEIHNIPRPSAGPGELLVRVAATSFNPADAAIRAGTLDAAIPLSFPFTLGWDFSGIVEEAGAGVSEFSPGDRVFGLQDWARGGAGAEFLVAEANITAKAPDCFPLGDVAALPGAALCAWQALLIHGRVRSGQRVLVNGAAGGVGVLAVQIAKAHGAQVIAVASSQRVGLLTELGADRFVDYTRQPIPDALKDDKLDLILNFSPASRADVDCMAGFLVRGGTLVSGVEPVTPETAEQLGIKAIRMRTERNASQLAQIATLVETGQLKPVVARYLPLEQYAEAHRDSGHGPGKTLILASSSISDRDGIWRC
jgi:NADPH:quinone reductase-like Zn-dependent oxidoreductase